MTERYLRPFYGESSMIMYRTDLMQKAGLSMPDAPSWSFIAKAAREMTDRDNDINGICLRGKLAGVKAAPSLQQCQIHLVRVVR